MTPEKETETATGEMSMTRRLALTLVAVAAACRPKPTVAQLDHVRVKRVQGSVPKQNPEAEAWNEAPEYSGPLAPQNVTPPMLQQPGIARVKVRALHDGDWVAFRLEWEDRAGDTLLGPSRFSDAAAVQLPRDRGASPSPMMGHPGAPVRLLYWKAAWQTPDMLMALHPNKPPTPYPYEAAATEHRAAMELQYAPARAVANPNLNRPNGAPVMLGEAEMFGSFTAVGDAQTDGKGVYREGKWRVVLAMSLRMAPSLATGQESQAAFALWEGSAQNAGARKMRSEQWVRLVME